MRAVGLHAHFLDTLVPVCQRLLDSALEADEITPGIGALELMRGIGNLCIDTALDSGYDARRLVALLLIGLRQSAAS